jgi:hypothetical protein
LEDDNAFVFDSMPRVRAYLLKLKAVFGVKISGNIGNMDIMQPHGLS